MRLLKRSLLSKNMGSGWLYFYIHFMTEVICFYCLSKIIGDSWILWFIPLFYDAMAFVPQSLIGAFCDKRQNINIGLIGAALLAIAGAVLWLFPSWHPIIGVSVLCLGNCCTHVSGAETTLRCSQGKLSHSAVFVSGGSFGVIIGRVLAGSPVSYPIIIAMMLTTVPFILLAEYYKKAACESSDDPCAGFNYNSEKLCASAVILLAVFIVMVRGYMGYGIPTTWKKTVWQSVVLYFIMGFGKALGGIAADTFGVRKTALFSACAALPFLLIGDKHMMVSLIGVMFFSMTMSITLAVLVSVLKKTPGLAFGLTTIGLFLGTAPIFFFKFTTFFLSSLVIIILTVISIAAMLLVIRKDVPSREKSLTAKTTEVN